MATRVLQLIIGSGERLKNCNHVSMMRVHAEVSLVGDPDPVQKFETPVHRDGGTNPTWNCPMEFTINESLAWQNRLALKIELETSCTTSNNRYVGEVNVPVKDFLDKPGDGNSFQFVSYVVRKRSGEGKPRGKLHLSYKFGGNFPQPSTTPPMSTALNEEPLPAYHAPGSGSNEGQTTVSFLLSSMAPMVLQLIIRSGERLKNCNHVSMMRVHAEVSLVGDPDPVQKFETPVHRDGGTNPTWNCPMEFTINESLARQNRLALKIELETSCTTSNNRYVGEVNVPVKDLLDKPGDGNSFQFVSYVVRKRSGEGKPRGKLHLSYKFGGNFPQPSTTPPMSTALNEEPVPAYHAPGSGSNEGQYAQPYPPAHGGAVHVHSNPPPYGAYPLPPQANYGYPHPASVGLGLGLLRAGLSGWFMEQLDQSPFDADLGGGFDGGWFDLLAF